MIIGRVVSFRRGKNNFKPRQYIILVEGVGAKKAKELINKKVVWKSPQGKEIKGVITNVHGKQGMVRARFERGLPGQALTSEVKIE